MIARTLAATALAGALVLAPTAALAAGSYPGPEDSLKCSVAQIPVSKTFTCTVGAPNGATVEIHVTVPGAGTTIYGPVTVTNNKAVFTITAPNTVGVLGVSAVINGEAVDTASIDVVAESTDGGLAGTGFENAGLAVGAGVLLVVGATTVFVAARRRQLQNA